MVYKCVILIAYLSMLAQNLNVLRNHQQTSYEMNPEMKN